MEEEGGANMWYSSEVYSSYVAFKILKFLPILVVSNLCSKCFESNN